MFGKTPLLNLLVALGVGLRVCRRLHREPLRPLFLDEILVASNITGAAADRSGYETLGLDQVAPGGFLLLEKLSVLLLGSSERALRLVPLLFSIAGVVLFRRLAERTLTGRPFALAVALFAIGLPFIRYAAEVKQYGIDATAGHRAHAAGAQRGRARPVNPSAAADGACRAGDGLALAGGGADDGRHWCGAGAALAQIGATSVSGGRSSSSCQCGRSLQPPLSWRASAA